MNKKKPIKLKTTWEELFSKEIPAEERRSRWEIWKQMALKAGDQEMVDYWMDAEGCAGCLNQEKDWCQLQGLPCSINSILTFRLGMIGMACMGAGYDDGGKDNLGNGGQTFP
jgi:hypothetical protein